MPTWVPPGSLAAALVEWVTYSPGARTGVMVAVAVLIGLTVWTRGRTFLVPLRFLTGNLVIPNQTPWAPTWVRRTRKDALDKSIANDQPSSGVPRTWYTRMAGWQRMFVNWAIIGLTAATLFATRIVIITFAALLLAALALAVVLGLRAARQGLAWWAYRRAVEPWQATARRYLGWPESDHWTRWVELPKPRWEWTPRLVDLVPESAPVWLLKAASTRVARVLSAAARLPRIRVPLNEEDAEVRIKYPHDADVDDDRRRRVAATVKSRLTGGEWEVEWSDSKQLGTATHPKKLPGAVWYTRDTLEAFDILQFPLAKDVNGWYPIELRTTPHGMMSATTGYGKTQTQYTVAAHIAAHGGRGLILDPKRKSFGKVFGDVPGIAIATRLESQQAYYDTFFNEMQWRYDVMEAHPGLNKDEPDELLEFFTPWFILTDEKATLVKRFRTKWRANDGKGDEPEADMEREMLNLARGALMFIMDASQQGNADAFRDTEMRNNHAWRIAAGPHDPYAWCMMFPGEPRRKLGTKKGRAVLGIGLENIRDVQLARIDQAFARTIALEGVEKRAKAEREREKRIQEVTGLSLADLSRPAPTLPGAAHTWESVPGHLDEDTEPQVTLEMPENQPLPLLPYSYVHDASDPSEVTNIRSRRGAPNPEAESDEYVTGTLKDAAKYLEIPYERFKRSRHRYLKRNPNLVGLPGENQLPGNQRSWRKSDLSEWANQIFRDAA